MNTMIAFHGDPAIKAKYLTRVRAHRAADEIIQGTYWEKGRGCAVGCTIHGSDHSRYEIELGIPRLIARLEDGIFEGLEGVAAKSWPERFLDCIPVGADLALVGPRFLHWLLVDPADGVIKFAKSDQARSAIQTVADLYVRKIGGDVITPYVWRDSRRAADAYADAAAYAAAYAAYAAYAADAAAYAAAYAYAAADAAAYAADAAAARQKSRLRQSEKLIQLLTEAPLPPSDRLDAFVRDAKANTDALNEGV